MRRNHCHTQRRTGFTAVEILIVVAALAILAVIVIPQVSDSLQQAKESAMLADLQMLTTAIERYKLDHDGLSPNNLTGNTLAQLLAKTDVSGNLGAAGVFGPYMLDRLPPNPLNNDANVYAINQIPPLAPETLTGWLYYAPTGQIWAGQKK